MFRSAARAASSCWPALPPDTDAAAESSTGSLRDASGDVSVGELALEQLQLVAVSGQRVLQPLRLHLGAVDRRQVRLHLRRQLTGVRAAVRLEPFLLLHEALTRVLELGLEELAGSLRQLLAVFQVLVDEQARQPFGDPHGRDRRLRDVAHPERVAAHGLNADVPAHPLDDVLHEPAVAALPGTG